MLHAHVTSVFVYTKTSVCVGAGRMGCQCMCERGVRGGEGWGGTARMTCFTWGIFFLYVRIPAVRSMLFRSRQTFPESIAHA